MKKCQGNGKSKGFGCGEPLQYTENPTNKIKTYKATYGLCQSCYTSWLISDNPHAKKAFNYLIRRNKVNYEKSVKDNNKKELKIMKQKLETKSDLENKLQKEINLIVRLIDKGHKCISSGRELGKSADAGHLYTVGGNPTLRFHLFNIFSQSVHDNQWKSGNELEYFFRLGDVFSSEFQDFVVSLKQIPALHLSKDDLREKTQVARGLIKWLKLQDRTFTTEERISIRSDFNNKLGIYPQHFSEFKL